MKTVLKLVFVSAGAFAFLCLLVTCVQAELPLLKVDSTSLLVGLDSSLGSRDQKLAFLSALLPVGAADTTIDIDGLFLIRARTPDEMSSFASLLQPNARVRTLLPAYLSADNTPVLVGRSVIVEFTEAVEMERAVPFLDSMNLVLGGRLIPGALYYMAYLSLEDARSVLQVCREIDSIGVDFLRSVAPNYFITPVEDGYRMFDFYRDECFHVAKVVGSIGTNSVWDFAGLVDSVLVVAVLDDGMANHADFPATRILSGKNYTGLNAPDENVTPPNNGNHGMSCAGLIGASHTLDSVAGLSSSTGIISMNPHVKILPVKILSGGSGSFIADSTVVNALLYAADNADVISNSWSYPTGTPNISVIEAAIGYISTTSNNSKGVPLIWSAGNSGGLENGVKFPARSAGTLVVGATKLNDSLWYYSSYDSFTYRVDVVAPSGDIEISGDVWSIDRTGGSGYNNTLKPFMTCPATANDNDYVCKFGGTSAAAPIASGIASLLLAKDTSLTATQVYEIMRGSAVSQLDWGPLSTPDYKYGYGRVDAFRAVLSISHGDVDNNDQIDIGDVAYLASYLFLGGAEPFPSCMLGEVNCIGNIDVADVTFLVENLFYDGPAIPKPCFDFQ